MKPAGKDRYSPERRAATLDVFANAGRSARFMTALARGQVVLRRAMLELAQSEDFGRRFADPRQVQPSSCTMSPLTSLRERDREFSSGPAAGTVLLAHRLGDLDSVRECRDIALADAGPGVAGP